MRKLNEQHKIPGRSLPEIVSRYDAVVSRQQTTLGRKFNDRKVPAEAITNAVVMHFLDLSAADQDAILDRYLPGLDRLLSGSADGPAPAQAPVKHTADLSGLEDRPD